MGMKRACAMINYEINPLLKGLDLSNLKKVDDTLRKFMLNKEEALVAESAKVVVILNPIMLCFV